LKKKNKREIKQLIQTLSVFVVGNTHHNSMIQPWRTKGISLADIDRLKLVGIPKTSCTLTNAVEKYVSIFDYDAETFRSPAYSGNFVEQILSRQKNWVVKTFSY